MAGTLEWIAFLALSATAVAMAASMLLTMSMYRAGLALMSSFVALAGLFVLLDADLLAAIQIMMNVGGMLVMVLFMVMLMMDPGGEMMWDMKRKMHLAGPGALSMSMPLTRTRTVGGEHTSERASEWTCPMHPEVRMEHPGDCPKCGMALVAATPTARGHSGEGRGHQHHQMMVDMAMSTAQLPWALALGVASAVGLGVLLARTPWPLAAGGPTRDATSMVGELLLSRYMIAFEGAAFLILAGIVGAVIFARREASPPAPTGPSGAERDHTVYMCPMHPDVRQRGPGECPKCGMALVPSDDETVTSRGDDR